MGPCQVCILWQNLTSDFKFASHNVSNFFQLLVFVITTPFEQNGLDCDSYMGWLSEFYRFCVNFGDNSVSD